VNRSVVVNNESHVAFNGGEGGVASRPTAAEESAAREPHQAALSTQTEHEHAASQNRALFASENHGAPAVAATARPGEFSGHNVVAAKAGAEYHAPAMSPKEARASANENRVSGNNSRTENNSSTPNEPKSSARSESRTESAARSKPEKQSKPPKHPPKEEKRERER
jgi:hypothetical protein